MMEMQIKTTSIFQLAPFKMDKTQIQWAHMLVWIWERKNTYSHLVGVQTSASSVEIAVKIY